jgi:CotH protein/lamin tail-like protein
MIRVPTGLSVGVTLALMATALVGWLPAAHASNSVPTVVLNEINCEATDWVELVNTSDSPAEVSGWLLTDDPLNRVPPRSDHRYVFPAATTIQPGAFLVVEKVAGGFPFGISCGSDTIHLADAAGSLVDEFVVPTTAAAGDTWGRFPDGTGSWVETAPTKGSVNEPSSAGGGPPPDPSWLFDPTAVHVIDLTLPQSTIDALNADPEGEYHDATFTLTRAGGQTYGPLAVGVRLKGGAFGFRDLDHKAAFKIKFNFSVAGQRLQGLKKLTLNNMVQDDSMVHETLAYRAFRAVGVLAPRTGFAYVRVNGADYGIYLDVEQLDDVALRSRFATTQHLYEGNYTNDVLPGASGSFEVDEGSATDRSDLEALILAVNSVGPWSQQVGQFADLVEMTREWAVERYIGHWDSYSGWDDSAHGNQYSPNNYFLHSDASGLFSMLPWGTDQTWSTFPIATGFDDGQAIMFTKCLADPTCGPLYRDAVNRTASTIRGLDLDGLADSTASLLRPWQELDPRKEASLDDIDAGVAGVHEYLAMRLNDAAAWLTPPLVTGVPDRDPNAAGWYRAPVTIDWQATDDSGPPTDPPNTDASTEGSDVVYTSGPSCDPSYNCATGSLTLSIDSVAPSLAPTFSPATILLHGTATATPHATDATSGVASQSCGTPDTSSAGVHTLTCTATDNAGNSTTVNVGYVVQYKILGFFSPVVPGSKWKPGQTVPIKVALGDTNDTRISDAEAQGLLSPSCVVRFVATGVQTADACMKYDTANHQLVFNWKLGKPTGNVTISVQIGYAGTTTKTVLSEPIAITK